MNRNENVTAEKLRKPFEELMDISRTIIATGGCIAIPRYFLCEALTRIYAEFGADFSDVLKQHGMTEDELQRNLNEFPLESVYIYMRGTIRYIPGPPVGNAALDEIFPICGTCGQPEKKGIRILPRTGTLADMDMDAFLDGMQFVLVRKENLEDFIKILEEGGMEMLYEPEEGEFYVFSCLLEKYIIVSGLSEDAVKAVPVVARDAILLSDVHEYFN